MSKDTGGQAKANSISNCCIREMVLIALSYGGKIVKEGTVGGQCLCGEKIVMRHGTWIAKKCRSKS